MYFNFSLISHVVVEIFNLKAGGFIWQMGCALCGSVHVTGLTRIFCHKSFIVHLAAFHDFMYSVHSAFKSRLRRDMRVMSYRLA
jgi:hypothetical protein